MQAIFSALILRPEAWHGTVSALGLMSLCFGSPLSSVVSCAVFGVFNGVSIRYAPPHPGTGVLQVDTGSLGPKEAVGCRGDAVLMHAAQISAMDLRARHRPRCPDHPRHK